VRTRLTAVALLALCLLALPTVAFGSVWRAGATSTFGLSDYGGLLEVVSNGDPVLRPPYEVSTFFDGTTIEFEPRSVRMAKDGTYLVACGKHGCIIRLSASGKLVRTYSSSDIPGLERPFDVFPLDDGGMLVVDRSEKANDDPLRTCRVMRLDASNRITWEYRGDFGPGLGNVWDPYTVELLPTGNLLMSDSIGHRVIEIDDAGEIVWRYGEYLKGGSGGGLLNRPHSAQRIAETDTTLICDSNNHRVVEVRSDKSIAWQYGGTEGRGPGQLSGPNSARRLPNGDTLICDSGNNRVVVVNPARAIVEEYGAAPGGAFDQPVAMLRLQDGSTLVADLGHRRLVRYRYRPQREYVAVSGLINPAVGKMKRFSRIDVSAVRPAGTAVVVEYTTGGAWADAPANGTLPSSAKGSAIRYRLRLTTGAGDAAPIVNDVAITWSEAVPTEAKNDDGSFVEEPVASVKPKSGHTSGGSSSASGGGHAGGSSGGAGSGGGGQSGADTEVQPGGTSRVNEGAQGGLGGPGQSVQAATTLSGWVMDEVKDDVGGLQGSAGTSGFAPSGGLGDSKIPGVALMFVVYAIGVAWSPASKVVVRFAVAAMTH